ncbi:hypothetical protein CCY99_01165 [Helicobacter sp. 16-1353]|uniref:prepilin-type N-terminal cleavage/methylation domain-containing protein n=1 Tax=Helicobacter sp. 16-1353 TaxID=2004996 RepID=UPI000DCC0EB8|nr:prepilin-type N-terminal cleavage/methylation domain-containing protein [Helicobacter sp. 16-1353]RAX55337.1 hypothetical protein CCY99_01165 [Helicobacter sp. 16-1353]
MERNAFSMMELVFVIVILAVVAAVAVPRFVATRTDSRVAKYKSDIATVLKSVPARIVAENIDATQSAPQGFSSWNEWIIDTAGLDRGRWAEAHSSDARGIMPMIRINDHTYGYCGAHQAHSSVLAIHLNGDLIFNPDNLKKGNGAELLCQTLMNSYPSGSNRTIPLVSTKSVRF